LSVPRDFWGCVLVIDPKYSIGIEEIDLQHARWIHLIEEFRRISSGHLFDATGFHAAGKALDQLIEYTKIHFASEEQLLVKHKYPELAAHKKEHFEIEAKILELREEIRVNSRNKTSLKLNLFITIWLFDHILNEDGKYANFILGKSAAAFA
jgi:hemerythrin